MLERIETRLAEVCRFSLPRFTDNRGSFEVLFEENSIGKHLPRGTRFIQDNISRSQKNVIRGLHYQVEPFSQGKLLTCIQGRIFDVVVDIRTKSPTFLEWESFDLSSENPQSIYIPPGFAHGFLSRSDNTIVHYKVTSDYNPSAERTIYWQASDIGIEWPITGEPMLSSKDEVCGLAIDVICGKTN